MFVWRKNRISTAISVGVVVARVTSDSLGYKAALVWGKEKKRAFFQDSANICLAQYYCPRNIPGSV